jgi:hypothetical protein
MPLLSLILLHVLDVFVRLHLLGVVVVVVMISKKKEDRCKSTMRLLDGFYSE